MSWRVVATAHGLELEGSHTVEIVWRDDDPWGAIWRGLHRAVDPYMPDGFNPSVAFPLVRLTLTMCHVPEVKFDFQHPPKEVKVVTRWAPGELPKGVKF